MALLDDLKGLLSPEEFAKIEGNAALKTRVEKSDELYSYYAGAEDDPPARKHARMIRRRRAHHSAASV